jgi:hypothetical protein
MDYIQITPQTLQIGPPLSIQERNKISIRTIGHIMGINLLTTKMRQIVQVHNYSLFFHQLVRKWLMVGALLAKIEWIINLIRFH